MQLFEALAKRVATWREENYKHEDYPAIAEILEWASNPDVPERKNDLVEGKYVVEAENGTIVAVKVMDMLGEEVLVKEA